jgi:5-formyltetrahydrofolate cyclo-ligase
MNKPKIVFRKEMKSTLSKVTKSSIIQQSTNLTKKLLANTQYKAAKKISIFLNMKGEISTHEIVQNIFEAGKQCFVPLCTKDTMKMVEIKSFNDYLTLTKNSWGIPEPLVTESRQTTFEVGVDLIIMPGLAFDRQGNRIGYGKGYYDRFLLKSFKLAVENGWEKPATIAIALKEQLVDKVPVEDTDIKPDVIMFSE